MPFFFPGDVPIESGIDTAQDHLDWLVDFRQAFELFQDFMAMYLNDAQNVVIPAGPEGLNVLKVVAASPLSLRFSTTRGIAVVDRVPFSLLADTLSAVQVAPTGNPRKDTVVADPNAKQIRVITGTEAGSPVAPAAPTGTLKLCEIFYKVGSSVIKDSDDTTNSHIIDSRVLGG